ncbi:hypothetical protein QGN32_10370 [Mycolicibacterium sp. ND9-15]|uniref:hypothetical protein n=1 Tax=Mycolicibacterium sp. ND9-15 TaxID=3042320 RepID=UPI002DDBD69C|nr:hypothetical protein [Mycolicibacterium sp. ND9-15]WSE58212.1 hypothetical protein QGN32_10370 [Mycolicibacterium sp. ND9-15]
MTTDNCYDADPFPKIKPGVGLLISLRTKVLADTAELTPPTPVEPGLTGIPVTDSRPVSRVLV